MKPWEHPKVKQALKKLTKTHEEKRTLNTPNGPKQFKITHYQDSQGNQIIEIKGLETDDYILIPKKTLKQILQEARE